MRHSLRRMAGLSFGMALLAACADGGPLAPTDTLSPDVHSASIDPSLQATPAGYIRIGVVPSATAVTLGAEGEWTLRDKATGNVLFSGDGGAVEATLLAAGEVRERDWIQVTCTANATAQTLRQQALDAGFEVFLQDLGFCTRVRFGTLPARSSGTARAAFQASLGAAGLPNTGLWFTMTMVTGETQLSVAHDGTERVATSPVVLEAESGIVRINGAPYRGLGEVWTNGGGTLAGINEVLLEEYLYGVVPRELPPVPYGELEAQKAQAVAARTYAIANMGKRASDGYDLLPTTSDQVYGGYAAEHPVSTGAVEDTHGVVAVYNGTLITTLYHSTSGGFTANSEDVYANPVAYLRGVPDSERGKALEHVPTLDVFMRNANPTNLRAAAEGDFEADWSVYHRWVADWSHDEMARALSIGFGVPVSEVYDIRVVDRADHGRVLRIEFDTDAGTLVGLKDQIRSRLPYPLASGAFTSLRSTLFFIEESKDGGWKAYGGGWGHGVGMSQTGAVGMAVRGRSYEEILKHYYQGIALETRNTGPTAASTSVVAN